MGARLAASPMAVGLFVLANAALLVVALAARRTRRAAKAQAQEAAARSQANYGTC